MSTTELVPVKAESEILTTPLRVLERMMEKDLTPEVVAKFFELHVQVEKREAEKAFVAAVARFKAAPPEIVKNRRVKYNTSKGDVDYKHATLDRVTTSIGTALAQYGLSAGWRTEQKDGRIRVTCILRHEKGHSEETTLEALPDSSGSKNDIQAIGSTVTYLERYTLLAATGMATADDSDGITFGDIEESLMSIKASANLDELQERFNKAYKRAHAAKHQSAMAILIHEKDERKKQLSSPEEAEFAALCEKQGLNQAQRTMLRGRHTDEHKGVNLKAAIEELRGSSVSAPVATTADSGELKAEDPNASRSTDGSPASLPETPTAAPEGKKGKQASLAKTQAPSSPEQKNWGF
jgi:hypothetical protein